MTSILPASHRRKHSNEFKTDLVTMCRQAGISVSAVAQAHGVNANLLRRFSLIGGADGRILMSEPK